MSTASLFTAEGLYAMGADARFELIHGELFAYPFHGGWHGATAGRLTAYLGEHLRANPLGTLYAGQIGCVLGRNPDTVLAPDLAFVRRDPLNDHPDDGFLLVPPDLVAEVLDPWDSERWIERKVRIYLGAGVEQIWIVDPGRRELIAHRRDHSIVHYRYDDIVPGGDVLSGLNLRLGDIFE